MGAARRRMTLGILVLGTALGGAACSDETTPTVSQAAYLDEAERLCERQGSAFDEAIAEFESAARSDAERVAEIRAEFVPRVRAIIRGINRNGYPADRAASYRTALNDALVAIDEIEDDTYVLIDRMRRDSLPADEDPFVALEAAMLTADIPCA